MDKEEFAWRLYMSEREFITHHENQRTNASSILAATAAALVVAISSGAVTGVSQIVVSATLTLVGVFGTIFSGKLYELIQMHAARSYSYLAILDEKFPEIDVNEIKSACKARQKARFPFFASISLNRVWFYFHSVVALCGFAFTIILALGLK
ncbi:MAG: hypothetical protein ACSHXD_17415 [Marinosulfonomonas sp.]